MRRNNSIYAHAEISIKKRALARTAPRNTNPGRYRASDPFLGYLEQLSNVSLRPGHSGAQPPSVTLRGTWGTTTMRGPNCL